MSTLNNNKGQRNSKINHGDNNDHQDAADATRRARNATIHIQNDTQASLARTLAAAAETTQLGATTLDELYRQRKTLDQTKEATDRLNAELDKTEKLQNTLSRLAGWNHWGKRSEAKKLVKQDLKMEQQADQEKRLAQSRDHERMTKNIATPSSSSSLSSTSSPCGHGVIVEKKKKSTWKKDKPPAVTVSPAEKKTLGSATYGLGKSSRRSDNNINNSCKNMNDKEHDEYLRRIEATDHEIDAGLNAVDDQLDQLLDLAQTMQNEVRVHGTALDQVDDELQNANQKQKVASHRLGRFF